MSAVQAVDFGELPSGPELLLSNAFRLAQMPVDATDRRLKKRQKRLEQALGFDMAMPPGESPVFPIGDTADASDTLKAALHRISDPAGRLLDEIFWFWPSRFGASAKDEGLRLLCARELDAAQELWLASERTSGDLVATHNLALLHQLLALEHDMLAVAGPEASAPDGLAAPARGDDVDGEASRHWQESLQRWKALLVEDAFWSLVRDRIQAINDPRLPLDTATKLRHELGGIVLSVNVGLAVKAADLGRRDEVGRQRRILGGCGFDDHTVASAFRAGAQDHRERVSRMCKAVREDVDRDPLHGNDSVRVFEAHISTLLHSLEALFPDPDLSIEALFDDAAESVRSCMVTYTKKTQDWENARTLLQSARPMARTAKVQAAIDDDLSAVDRFLEEQDNWVEEGYFSLPERCVQVLEDARALELSNRYEEALEVLRGALHGYVELPHDTGFEAHLWRCLAYVLRRMAWDCRKRGIDEFNVAYRQVIEQNLRYEGYFNDYDAACCGCGREIHGSYTVRTIAEVRRPFCQSCNQRIEKEVAALDRALDPSLKRSLDLIVLCDVLLPDNTATREAMEVMRKEAAERNVRADDAEALKREWNLRTAAELIRALGEDTGPSAATFRSLSRLVAQQLPAQRERTLEQLFEACTRSVGALASLLPVLHADPEIFAALVQHCLSGKDDSGPLAGMLVEAAAQADGHVLKFATIEMLEREPGAASDAIATLLDSLARDAERLVVAHGLESFENGELGDLLSLVRARDGALETRLLRVAMAAAARTLDPTRMRALMRAVHGSRRTLTVFYEAVFGDGADFDTAARTALVDAIAAADPAVQFAALMHLREAGVDVQTTGALEAEVKAAFLSCAPEALEREADCWTDGLVGRTFRYAVFYDGAFATTLFDALAGALVGSEAGMGAFLDGALSIEEDRRRLLELLDGSAPGLPPPARERITNLLAAHWDPALRLFALQSYIRRAGEQPDAAFVLVRFLADLDDAVRGFASSQLASRRDWLLAAGLPALASDDGLQRSALVTLLDDLRLDDLDAHDAASFGHLVVLLGVISERPALAVLGRYTSALYPERIDSPTVQQEIGALRYLRGFGSVDQQALAKTMLEKLNSGLLRLRTPALLRPVAGEPWWRHDVAAHPTETAAPGARSGRDARMALLDDDLPAVQAPPSASARAATPRQRIVAMAREGAADGFVECPVCDASLRPKNLVRHYDRLHADQEFDGAVARPRAPTNALTHYPEDSISRGGVADPWPHTKPFEDPDAVPLFAWRRPVILLSVLALVASLHIHANPYFLLGVERIAGEVAQLAHQVQEDGLDALLAEKTELTMAPERARRIPEATVSRAAPETAGEELRMPRGQKPGARTVPMVETAVADEPSLEASATRSRGASPEVAVTTRTASSDGTVPRAATRSEGRMDRRSAERVAKAARNLDVAVARQQAAKVARHHAQAAFERQDRLAASTRSASDTRKARELAAHFVQADARHERARREVLVAQRAFKRSEAQARQAYELRLAQALQEQVVQAARREREAARAAESAAAPATQPGPGGSPRSARTGKAATRSGQRASDSARELTGKELREMQALLTRLGFEPGPVDGLWGKKTRTAMRRFQQRRGLQRTTRPDLATLVALRRAVSNRG